MEIPNLVMIMEVLSPRTATGRSRSQARRLFRAAERRALPDRRPRPPHDDLAHASAGAIETRVIRDGVIGLDPPGFEAQAAAFFAIE